MSTLGLACSSGAGWRLSSGCRFGCRLGCPGAPGSGVPALFAQRWAEVLREYAVRYGAKVHGWWIDGCYAPWYGQTGGARGRAGPGLASRLSLDPWVQ